jgi:hypothetical protein
MHLRWRWNDDRRRLMVHGPVRQKTDTRAQGDWPFRQLKAKPPCGTVTALTRTEFSIKFSWDSARPAEPVSIYRCSFSISSGTDNYEGWNGFDSRSSSP